MKKLIAFFIFLSALSLFAQTNLPVGTIRKPIMTDASGLVVSTNIVFTNVVSMTVTPTLTNHVVRFQDLTNAIVGASGTITNIANAGTGTGIFVNVTSKIANFMSLVPGNGITFTNSGNTNLTIYSTSTGGGNVSTNNPINFYLFGSTNIFNGVTMVSNLTVNNLAIFKGTVTNLGPFIVTNSIFSSGATRTLSQSDGSVTVDWESMTLKEGLAGTTVDWNARVLSDTGFSTSLNWGTLQLFRPGQMTLDWASSLLVNAQGTALNWQYYNFNGGWTNQGSFFINTNLTVYGIATLSNVVANGSSTFNGAVTNNGTTTVSNFTGLGISTFNGIVSNTAGLRIIVSGAKVYDSILDQAFDLSGVLSQDFTARTLNDTAGNSVYAYGTSQFKQSQSFNSNLTVSGTVFVTNSVIVYSTNKWAYFNIPNGETNVFFNFGSTPVQYGGKAFTTLTNMPNGAQFNSTGTIYTNTANSHLSAVWALPSGATTYSEAGIWVADNGFTNIYGIVSSVPNATFTAFTNSSSEVYLNNGCLFAFTNISTGAGASSVVIGDGAAKLKTVLKIH